MRVSIYPEADLFLDKAQAYLEHEEVVNGLILGICFGLQQNPPQTTPFLATVEDNHGLTLAAVMTPPYRLVLYSHLNDPSGPVRALIQQLQQASWTVPGMQGPVKVADTFARLWGKPFTLSMAQGVYELREVIQPAYPPGSFRAAASADLDLVTQWGAPNGHGERCQAASGPSKGRNRRNSALVAQVTPHVALRETPTTPGRNQRHAKDIANARSFPVCARLSRP